MADNTIANAIKFLKGEEKSLPAAKTEGQVYFAYKNVGTAKKPSYTGAIYIDTPIGGTQNRIKMTANADIAEYAKKANADSQGNLITGYLRNASLTGNADSQTFTFTAPSGAKFDLRLNGVNDSQAGLVTSGDQIFPGYKTLKLRAKPSSIIGSDTENSNGWYKVATSTMSGWGNTNVLYYVKNGYSSEAVGILDFEMRSNNDSIQCWACKWLVRGTGFTSDMFRVVINEMTWTLYVYQPTTQYGRISITEISNIDINGGNPSYKIIYYNSTTKETTEPDKKISSSDGGQVYLANKTTSDGNGQNIANTYIKSLSYSNDGKQLIATRGSGDTSLKLSLPIASTTKSGIVTTDAQSFGGTKTFTTINSTNLTVTGSSGFNYSGIETATESKARPIWFADSSTNGKPVVNTNFTYNPATQTLSVANLSGTADKAIKDSGGQNIRSTYISSVEADKDNKYKYNFKTPTGAIRNSITIYDEFQKRSQVDATTDWNTLTSTGIYKVQMSAWGDATKMHSPNSYNKDLYSFGILLVFESIANDSEKRFTQIYIPHNSNISVSGSAYKRMHNGSDITTDWQGWHPIARGLNWSELTGKPNYAGSSSAGGAATSANKLNTNAGSTTLPVYFSNGVPVVCSTSLGVSITGNAASATKLTSNAGSIIQPIYFKDGKPVATTYSLNAHVQTSSGEDFSTGGWKKMNGNVSGSYITVGYNNNHAIWNSGRYSASIVFGKYDTKGLLDCSCDTSIVTFGGASNHNSTDDNPYWYFKLSGTSGQTYTFPVTSKTLAANDGSNASGTWGISITGNAASANKLNTNAGSATKPIYFSGGIPIQCNDTLASSITGSAYRLFIDPPEDKKAGGLYMFQRTSDTNFCPTDDWWSILRTQHPGYDNGYWQEMAYNFHNDRICFRRNVNGTKTPWKEIAFTDSDITGKSASTDALNWTHGNEIRFTKPNYTEPQTLHIAYAWADGSQSNLINDYRFNNGNGYNLAQVTASQFNGNLNGNANTASNLNGINTILSTGIENSAITIKTNNNGIFTLTNNCSLRNAIDFRWYGTNWQIGNIRGVSTDSIGFGFAFSSNSGNTFALKSYIDTNGYYHGGVVGNANTATALTSSAGSSTQPIYFSGGKPVACTYTLSKSVPADAKFTDTWRGIQNNVTSDSTTDSLSAAQGKYLKGLIDNKLSLSGGHMTGDIGLPSAPSTIDGSVPYAGSTVTTDNIVTFSSYKTYLGTYMNSKGIWRNIISIRHRNGTGDGINYGMMIYTALTGADSLRWNKQTGEKSWQGERIILDSSNYTSYTGQYLPLSGGTMTGNITYNKLGTCYIGAGSSDNADMVGGGFNNLVISSWNGISFTTSCSSTFLNKNAVSIDCRNGVLAAASLRVGNGSGSTINFCTNGGTAAPGAKIVAYNDRIEFVFA